MPLNRCQLVAYADRNVGNQQSPLRAACHEVKRHVFCKAGHGYTSTHTASRGTSTSCRVAPDPLQSHTRVQLKIQYHVHYGQSLGMVGAGELLGNWDPSKAVRMMWTEGDCWIAEIAMPTGPVTQLEYKYIVINGDGRIAYWKPGSNYKLDLIAAGHGGRVVVQEFWDEGPRRVQVDVQVHGPADHVEASSTLETEATVAMDQLHEALGRQVETIERVQDPTALEVIMGDRLLAAASNKAVAMNKALQAAEAFPHLPAGQFQPDSDGNQT